MRTSLRQAVQVRDEYRCRYCGVSELDTGSTMTVDHIQPPIQGGTEDIDNVVYCCFACNHFKNKYWKTEPDLQLLNPLVDDLAAHYQEHNDGTLLPLTERGRKHIEVLHLNRPRLVQNRLRKRHYQNIDAYVATLEAELQELRRLNSEN